ncbi:hypothetical protein [Blackfly microvirus SF02]|uniref:Uncharacterized protein n=1 Tax=Blackfly microvirus SF02 TaxID=2576452 RepID=A0A4P8PK39_9VIRU|nr:hypothetical protein [Blackfly microvirus SF02]
MFLIRRLVLIRLPFALRRRVRLFVLLRMRVVTTSYLFRSILVITAYFWSVPSMIILVFLTRLFLSLLLALTRSSFLPLGMCLGAWRSGGQGLRKA